MATLACHDFIDMTASPTGDLQQVLGVVALPTSKESAALQTSEKGDPDPAARLFAKRGLLIRADTRFELVVPDTQHFLIGWGNPGHRSRHLAIECPAPTGGRALDDSGSDWLAYAGGYWLPDPACVALLVRAHGQEQRVHIGLGTPCPGQQPPAGRSAS